MNMRPFMTHRENTLQAALYLTTWMLFGLAMLLRTRSPGNAALAGIGAAVGLAAIVSARRRGLPGM